MIQVSSINADRIFIPEDFAVPLSHEWPRGKLVPLSESLAAQDFAAVSSSADRIRNVFGPTNGWPAETITDAENLADILRHQTEFASRLGFAYGILDCDSGDYIGCLYIKRIKSREEIDQRKRVFNAQAFFWLSQGSHSESREAETYRHLSAWLATAWPFHCLAWPGRSVSWEDWKAAETSEPLAQSLGRQHFERQVLGGRA